MARTAVTLDEIRQLDCAHQQRIPDRYMDENQHMNVQYYLHMVEQGLSEVFRQVGMGALYAQADQFGNFALEQHIRYFAEILIGDQVSVHVRLLDLTPKRSYMMGFLINDTRGQLAATVESVAMNIDMTERRGAPYPPAAMAKLDRLLERHQSLTWDAPVCGAMKA